MRSVLSLLLILSMAGSASAQEEKEVAVSSGVKGQVIAAASEVPIAFAEVEIRIDARLVARTTTDGDGNYRASLPEGIYEITFKQGSSGLTRQFEVRLGKITKVNGRISQEAGEVIIINERKARPARATNFNARKTPPYSDKAISSNRWARAWLLLDVDAAGTVTRVKFINRPGYGLDAIALAQVLKLEFSPSIDENGKAIRTLVVWSIEWPAYSWLIDRAGTASGMPRENNPFWGTAGPAAPIGAQSLRSRERPQAAAGLARGDFGTGFRLFTGDTGLPARPLSSMADSVPCRGTESISHDSISSAHRDCSLPDLDKPFDSESWIDATTENLQEPPVAGPVKFAYTVKHSDPDHQKRAGFFARAKVGVGFQELSQGNEAILIGGVASSLSLSLGYALTPRLIIHGDFGAVRTTNAVVEMEGRTVESNLAATTTGVGPAATWFVRSNAFVSGSLRLSRLTLSGDQNVTPKTESGGWVAAFGGGKEWWVGSSTAVGLVGELQVGRHGGSDEFARTGSHSFTLSLSATYN